MKNLIRKILKEETNQNNVGLLNIIKEHGLYDLTKNTGLSYKDFYYRIGELPRDVKIQYLKDVISDLQQMPNEIDLTMITGSIPLFQNENGDTVYAEYISNNDNALKVHVYLFGEDGEVEFDLIAEDKIDNETLDTIVTEMSEKLQHERNTRI